jgi:hypothetical protein
MADDLQALLARNQLGLSLAVDLSQALKSCAPSCIPSAPATMVTRSLRYESEVSAGIQSAIGSGSGSGSGSGGGGGSGSGAKESKAVSTIGAARQPHDELPDMGELFTVMDVPVFLTNDDVTP